MKLFINSRTHRDSHGLTKTHRDSQRLTEDIVQLGEILEKYIATSGRLRVFVESLKNILKL